MSTHGLQSFVTNAQQIVLDEKRWKFLRRCLFFDDCISFFLSIVEGTYLNRVAALRARWHSCRDSRCEADQFSFFSLFHTYRGLRGCLTRLYVQALNLPKTHSKINTLSCKVINFVYVRLNQTIRLLFGHRKIEDSCKELGTAWVTRDWNDDLKRLSSFGRCFGFFIIICP